MRSRTALIAWGGWDGHTPKACADLFVPWLASRGFKVRVSDTLDASADAAREPDRADLDDGRNQG